MKNQTKSYIFAALTILCWSTVATAFKITLSHYSPLQMLFWASATSMIILFVFLLITSRLSLLKTYSSKQITDSLVPGFLNPFVYYIVLFMAYDRLPAQIAQSLNMSWGIVLVLLSALMLKQKITKVDVLAIFISFCGVVIIATKGRFNFTEIPDLVGVGLALGSSLIWALFWIFNLKDQKPEDIKLFLNFLAGFVFIAVIAFITENVRIYPIQGFYGAVYIGIFEMGLAFLFWLKALQYSETTAKISNYVYLSPFISLFFIRWVLHEPIWLSSIAGLVLIVSGILVRHFFKKLSKSE